MSSILRLSSDASQTFTTRLSGHTQRISVWWQPSDEHWYISVEGLADGVRLVEEGLPIGGLTPGIGGQLYVRGEGAIDRDAWGRTHDLVFVPDDELRG